MRDLTEGAVAQLLARTKAFLFFFEGTFGDDSPPDVLRLWTGSGTIEWNGYSWIGVGGLAGISPLEETTDLRSTSVSLSLSGIPSDYVSLVLASVRQGRPGKLWLGFLLDDGTIAADPYNAFVGELDASKLNEDGKGATITLTYSNELIDLERPREYRFTSESQNLFYSGDKGFEYVPSIQQWNGKWGQA